MTEITLQQLIEELHAPRVVDDHVEVWEDCPNLCHGFGVCSICHDKGGYWRYDIELTRKLHYVGKHHKVLCACSTCLAESL